MSSVTNQSFERSLERFRARLSVDQKKEFEMASIDEVKETIVKIQDRIGPEKKLRNLARLRGFLEGMKQVEEAVQPFLNSDRVVGFVWGPIKLALLMASTHLRTLEILINTYEDIGTFIEGIRQLDRLFQNYSGARQVLEGCFDDILRFHQVALEELTRPNWRKAADLLWPQIKKRFDPILKSLQNRQAILSEGKLGAAIEEIQDSRHATLNKFQDIETLLKTSFDEAKEIQQRQHSALLEILLMDKGSIFTKLDAPDYQGDHQTALAQRHDDTSGSWLLQDPKFRQWADGKVRDDAVLYLNGMPGSGKTTLASTVIDYFKSDKDTLGGNLAFFYFKHQPQKASHKPLGGMLRAIVTQLLNQDHALLGPLQQKCGPLSKSDVVQEPFLKELGRDCLILQQRCWIILDGLDECDEPRTYQADKLKALQVIEWLLRKVLPAGPTDYCPIRILFCAQRDGYIDQKLAPYPSINLDTTSSHIHNVQQYVNLMTAEVKARFSLDRSMEPWIAHKVATTAKGMFLYAKVVLNNLLSQDSVAELKDELSGEHFPKGLNAAYERVVVRILDRAPISRRKTAETILGWLVCSPRALRWREIQSRFCIDSEKEICNYEKLRVDNGKVLCGSLVELNPCEYYKDLTSEAVISIVHETARSYLVQSGRFSLGVTHTKMALFCTQYLASNPFRVKELDSIEGSALAGYYGLLDYAVTSWKEHVRFVTSSDNALDEETRNNVRQSARKLLDTQTRETKSPDHAHETTPERSVADCSVSSLDQFLLKSDDRGFLREQITLIRGVIETMDQTTLPGKNAFFDLNGYGRFKCSRVGCFGFSEGFPNQKDRNRHTLEHEQPFKCSVNGCYAQTVGYSSQRDLDTHIKRLHCNQTNLDGLFPISKKRREDTIYTAAAEGNLDQVKFFQASGSPIDEPESPNKASSPLMLAAKNGHATICQYLVQEGVNPFLDRLGISPIIHAIMREDIDLARLFLNSSSMPPSKEAISKATAYSVCAGNTALFNLLLDISRQYFDLKSILEKTIHESSYIREQFAIRKATTIEKQKALLHKLTKQAYPSLYHPGSMVIRRSASNLRVEQEYGDLYQTLTKKEKQGGLKWTPMISACIFGKYFTLEFLLDFLDAHSDALLVGNEDASTALHYLVGRKHAIDDALPGHRLGFIRRILEATGSAAASIENKFGRLPLHLGIEFSCGAGAIQLLVEHTPNLDKENKAGQTPLEVAIVGGNFIAVLLLIESGRVDLTRVTREGETMHALARKYAKINSSGRTSDEQERDPNGWEKISDLLDDK